MNHRILVPLAWTFWGALVLLLLYGLFRVSTDRSTSPEAGRGLGVMVVVVLLVVVGLLGLGLHVAIRRQWNHGLLVMMVVLAYPIVMLIAMPVVSAWKTRSFEMEYARVGDFPDPGLAAMAQAISTNDTTALAQLLGGKAPPEGVDRAGNNLLAFALVFARDRRGFAAPVRVLLESGADPRQARIGETNQDVLNFMVLGMTEVGAEIVKLLINHKADVNARDPVAGKTPLGSVSGSLEIVQLLVENGAEIDALQYNGITPLVGFISTREWDSALYLVEKGANLDIANADGLSVDYYLKDWKESVYGEHPEGWDRVRAAIAARRARPNP